MVRVWSRPARIVSPRLMSRVQAPAGKLTLPARANGLLSEAGRGVREGSAAAERAERVVVRGAGAERAAGRLGRVPLHLVLGSDRGELAVQDGGAWAVAEPAGGHGGSEVPPGPGRLGARSGGPDGIG
jgi:hypothetical protein